MLTSVYDKRGKICKPYNSVLGEHFRAHWDVIPVSYSSNPRAPPIQYLSVTPAGSSPSLAANGAVPSRVGKETDSIKSSKSGFSYISSLGRTTPAKSTPATTPELVETNLEAQISDLSLSANAVEADDTLSVSSKPRIRIVYVTEQVSHHPPVSSYYATCPARHTELWGIDQIYAKVYGTTLRVGPGSYNKGIFVKLTGGPGEGELYNITHPTAAVNGILRGNFYVTVGESTIVTCKGNKHGSNFRAIIEYKEEVFLRIHYLISLWLILEFF
jgi:oxysterol-binding protein-related protein 9/10/11